MTNEELKALEERIKAEVIEEVLAKKKGERLCLRRRFRKERNEQGVLSERTNQNRRKKWKRKK